MALFCAEHVRQLEARTPSDNVMEMKSERKRKGKITLVSRRGPETSAEQRYKDRQVREATHERRAAENRPQQEVLAFSVEVGRMLRRPPSEDPKTLVAKCKTESPAGI